MINPDAVISLFLIFISIVWYMSQYRAFSQWKSNTLYLPKYCASKPVCVKNELDDLQKRRAEEFRQYQIRLLITDTNFSDLLGATQTQSY